MNAKTPMTYATVDKRMRRAKTPVGFTLVELLVVIAIIAILAGMVIGGVLAARQYARRAAGQAMIGNISMAIEAYYNDVNNYPPSFREDVTDVAAGNPGTREDWYGSQCLVQALIGYLGLVDPEDPSEGTLDGAEGDGFRMVPRGKVHGPYIESGKIKTSLFPTAEDPVRHERPAFVDGYNNPILYYRFGTFDNVGEPDPAGQGGYSALHNDSQYDPVPGDVTGDPNRQEALQIYMRQSDDLSADYLRRDYFVGTAGPNGTWWDPDDNVKDDDDITNLKAE